MAEFKTGDVVKMKSGGPAMTVQCVEGEIKCCWFQTDSFAAHWFHREMLEKVEKKEGSVVNTPEEKNKASQQHFEL